MMILYVGGGHLYDQQQPFGIDQYVPLATFDFFMEVKAFYAPFSVVFTDCESAMAALGC